jgi:hypothetical protein
VGFTNEIPSAEVSVLNSVLDTTGTKATLTTNSPDNAKYIVIWFYHADYDTLTPEEILATLTVNKGTTAKPYTPYVKHTFPIPEDVRPAHGINNEVYDYLDFGEQESVKRVGAVDMGTLVCSDTSYPNTFRVSVPNIKNPDSALSRADGFLIDCYDASTNVDYTNIDDKSAIRYQGNILIRDSTYTDAATFKAAMSGVMLYYELAEPIVTDISDILSDDNLISVEGGVTVTMVNEHHYDVPSEITYMHKEVAV